MRRLSPLQSDDPTKSTTHQTQYLHEPLLYVTHSQNVLCPNVKDSEYGSKENAK